MSTKPARSKPASAGSEPGADPAASRSRVFSKKKKKKKRRKNVRGPSSLLSFGDDEDTLEAFAPRSRKGGGRTMRKGAAKRRSRAAPTPPEANAGAASGAYLSSSTGLYTEEGLRALRSNAIYLEGRGKKRPSPLSAAPPSPKRTRDDMSAAAESLGEPPGVPGRAEILAARRQRERIRAMGGTSSGATPSAPSYIPLSADAKKSNLIGSRPYGHRDDDDAGGLVADREDDEEVPIYDGDTTDPARVRFGDPGRLSGSHLTQPRASTHAETDPEVTRWEERMIKKGIGARGAAAAAPSMAQRSATTAAAAPRVVLPDIDSEMKRLREALANMQTAQSSAERDAARIETEAAAAEKDLTLHKSELSRLNEQYLFFQKLRDNVTDCLACLTTKAPLVEQACAEMTELIRASGRARRDRSAAHLSDMCRDAFGMDESGENSPSEPEKDEFGRDIGTARSNAMAERRRAREAAEARVVMAGQNPGLASDDEGDIPSTFDQRRTALVREVKGIFDDAKAEFQSLDAVKSWLETLKRKYPSAYSDTYMAMSAPLLFAPFVRLDLLAWDAMRSPQLQTMPWYAKLADYGMFGDVKEDDPDLDLVPQVVEKIVAPFVTDILANLWNPASAQQNDAACALAAAVAAHTDATRPNPTAMRSAALTKFANAANAGAKGPAVPGSAGSAGGKASPAWAFWERQWWRALKLLQAMAKWRGILDASQLRDLADTHIADHVTPFLRSELASEPARPATALNMARALASSMPPAWRTSRPYTALASQLRAFAARLAAAGDAAGVGKDIAATLER